MFVIRFVFPDEGPVMWAGMYQGGFGWAPTLATALMYDNREDAERVLANAYGPAAKAYASVVEVTGEEGSEV